MANPLRTEGDGLVRTLHYDGVPAQVDIKPPVGSGLVGTVASVAVNGPTQARVALPEPTIVSGVVRALGQPLANITVRASTDMGQSAGEASTNAAGEFRLATTPGSRRFSLSGGSSIGARAVPYISMTASLLRLISGN
jgi:hypothetical protein